MKKYLLRFLVLITLLVFPTFVVSADVTSNPRITDDANLFTEKESKQITKRLDEMSNLYDIDMVVITTNNSLGDGSFADFDASLEHFHDNNKYAHSSVFCGINMDPDNREVIIQAYGPCQKYIPDDIAQSITDDMVDDLKDARYADAIDTYIEDAEDAIRHKQLPVPLKVMGIELLISMIIGGIYVAILIYRSSAHSTATRHTYQEPGSAQILARTDSYTHTTVTRTKIESNSNSSSVGGGGHSHGGSHHSSGRSKF